MAPKKKFNIYSKTITGFIGRGAFSFIDLVIPTAGTSFTDKVSLSITEAAVAPNQYRCNQYYYCGYPSASCVVHLYHCFSEWPLRFSIYYVLFKGVHMLYCVNNNI